MRLKSKYIFLFFVLLLTTSSAGGCAKMNHQITSVERQGQQFQEQSRSRAVAVVDAPYLGAKIVPLHAAKNPSLNRPVMLRRKGTLSTIAMAISDLTSLSIQVAPDAQSPASGHANPAQPGQPVAQKGQGINMDLEALLQGKGKNVTAFGNGKLLDVSYKGTLRGLLDHVAMLSGYGWDYDKKNNIVTFAHFIVKTFTVLGAPGKVTYANSLTNKSKENSESGTSGTNVNQTVTHKDSSAQTAQASSTHLTFDILADTVHAVKGLLSKDGIVVCNQSAGTITVRDTPEIIHRVASYIDDINGRLSRQVALNVQVWSLNITDNDEVGINVKSLFKNENISVAAGSLTDVSAINTATATILTGQLKDSAGVLKALGEWGKASQVTSAGGLVMSGQPVPVMAVQRHAYLAGIGKSTTDYSQTTEVTPGEVTTGFAMTVIPYILDQRRVILQYNLNLSSLDEMKKMTTDDVTIELPQVSTQAFSQRSTMRMGQTLVLCGFEKETHNNKNSLGFISGSSVGDYGRTLLVITIKLESADV